METVVKRFAAAMFGAVLILGAAAPAYAEGRPIASSKAKKAREACKKIVTKHVASGAVWKKKEVKTCRKAGASGAAIACTNGPKVVSIAWTDTGVKGQLFVRSGQLHQFIPGDYTVEQIAAFCTQAVPTPSPAFATPATTPAPAPTAAPAPAVSIMPNVVCMNLQTAQDTIQTTGVFFSRSVDGTGQGRSQLIDSNWIVTAQTPPPGTPFGEGDAVLSAVKYGEPSAPC